VLHGSSRFRRPGMQQTVSCATAMGPHSPRHM
jgi:hypothetical protein